MLSLQAQALKPEGTFPCNLRAAQSDNQAKKRRNVDDISSYQIRIPKFPSSQFGSFAVSARRSKLEGLVFVNFTEMGSKRLNSKASVSSSSSCSSPAPKLSEPESGVKGTVGQDEILEIDSDKVEKMTIQQLRVNLRSVGIPAKGSKNDLVSAWKSFMNSQVNGKGSLELEDHVSSQKKQNENNPESKAGGLSSGEHFQGKTSVSEVSKLKGTKRKVKEGILGDNKVEIRTMQFGTQQGQSVEYFASKGKKSIQTKRKVSYATAVLHGRRNGEDEGDTRGKTIFPQMAKNSKTSPEIREMVQRMFELKKQVEGCITTMMSWLQDMPGVTMGDATRGNYLQGEGTSKTVLVQPTPAYIQKEPVLGTVQAQAQYHTSQAPQTQIANWTQPSAQISKSHLAKQPLKQFLQPKPSQQAQLSKQAQSLTPNPTVNSTTHNPSPSPPENYLNPKQIITCYPNPNPDPTLPNPNQIQPRNPNPTLPNPNQILNSNQTMPHNPKPDPTSTPTRILNQRNRNQENNLPREELLRLGSESPKLAGPVTKNQKHTGKACIGEREPIYNLFSSFFPGEHGLNTGISEKEMGQPSGLNFKVGTVMMRGMNLGAETYESSSEEDDVFNAHLAELCYPLAIDSSEVVTMDAQLRQKQRGRESEMVMAYQEGHGFIEPQLSALAIVEGEPDGKREEEVTEAEGECKSLIVYDESNISTPIKDYDPLGS